MKKFSFLLFFSLLSLSSIEGKSFGFFSTEIQVIIHYMYGLWDTTPLPETYKQNQEDNAKALMAKTYMHDKADTLEYVLKFSQEYDPDIYDLFLKIPRKVTQADLGRYLIIFYEGGMYCDLDAIIKNPNPILDNLDYRNGIWFTEHIVDTSFLGPREKPHSHRIAQYAFFVKEKESPLLLEMILESIRRIRLLFEEIGDQWSDLDVLWAAGPDVVTTIIHETSEEDFKVLNKRESNQAIIHLCSGSWRREQDKESFN